ncbi:MAG: LysR substrate-binding domain-containing protein [Candidatus Acidiferrales bacterium]
MEFHQLRYVCAIADTGSFSRAAERCRIAQPSLSQQVLKLEQDLGAKLFDRLGRSVRLTEVGRAFLPHARAILDEMEVARARVSDQNADFRGSVAVGVIPTVTPYLIPSYTAAFAKKYPDAKLRIVEDTTSILVESLRNLSIDVAILALPLRHKDLELFPIRTEPLFVVMRTDHPRASSESLALQDLRGESFVMLRDGHCFRDLSIATCTRARITPNIAFESGQFSSLLGMVAAGVGVSLVPEMAIDRNVGCRYVRLSDAQATRTIVAARLRGRSFNRVQQAFVSGIKGRTKQAPLPKTSAANRSSRR